MGKQIHRGLSERLKLQKLVPRFAKNQFNCGDAEKSRLVARTVLTLFICAVLLITEAPMGHAAFRPGAATYYEPTQVENFRLLKVHMNTRSLWSDGELDHYEMAKAAMSAGYDVIFFADNALQSETVGKLADPTFEDVNATGGLNDWTTGILGVEHSVAEAQVFTLPPPLSSNSTVDQRDAYNFALQRIKSGTDSLHLAIQSKSTTKNTAARDLSYAFVRDSFPEGWVFNGTSTPTHPLLINGLTFSADVFLDSLGIAQYLPLSPTGNGRFLTLNLTDNGWFYVKFYLVTSAPYGPTKGLKLSITLVYSDHQPDNWLKTIRSQLNGTTSKVIYLNVPTVHKWLSVNFNVTDLAGKLWNQSIVENWRLGNFEIGTRSVNDVLVDAYVDDVSISASNSWNPVEYFSEEIQNNLSNKSFAAYSGYSIDIANQPPMYAYGTSYLGLSRTYNLTDPTFWTAMTNEISSHGGTVMLGPFDPAYDDYIALTQAFGTRIIDATAFQRMRTGGAILATGDPIVFAALTQVYNPADYNSSTTWSMRVLSKSNSEADVLDAIAKGEAYLAVSNFTGTFELGSLAIPVGRNPIYIPNGHNASLAISFTGLSPGLVRVYDRNSLVLKENHNGNASLVASLLVRGNDLFYVALTTGVEDSLAVVSNPLAFVQTSMIPGGELYIDNEQWSLESSDWNSTLTQQRLRLVVRAPAGTTSDVYLFSPEFRPDAKSQDMVARSITIDNVTIDPATVYDAAKSTFVMQLHSTGEPLVLIFNFDIPIDYYAYLVLQSIVGLYVLAILPFAVTLPYTAATRHRKAKSRARRHLLASGQRNAGES